MAIALDNEMQQLPWSFSTELLCAELLIVVVIIYNVLKSSWNHGHISNSGTISILNISTTKADMINDGFVSRFETHSPSTEVLCFHTYQNQNR